jgi:hypothetical protein
MDPEETQEKLETHQKKMDEISMALLLNKTHYQKYLSKTDSQKYVEYLEYIEKCGIFRSNIIDITKTLLADPDPRSNTSVSQEVLESFEQYSKTLIKYLEIIRDSEESYKKNFINDEDADMMFPESAMNQPFLPNTTAMNPRSNTGFEFFTKKRG